MTKEQLDNLLKSWWKEDESYFLDQDDPYLAYLGAQEFKKYLQDYLDAKKI